MRLGHTQCNQHRAEFHRVPLRSRWNRNNASCCRSVYDGNGTLDCPLVRKTRSARFTSCGVAVYPYRLKNPRELWTTFSTVGIIDRGIASSICVRVARLSLPISTPPWCAARPRPRTVAWADGG